MRVFIKNKFNKIMEFSQMNFSESLQNPEVVWLPMALPIWTPFTTSPENITDSKNKIFLVAIPLLNFVKNFVNSVNSAKVHLG